MGGFVTVRMQHVVALKTYVLLGHHVFCSTTGEWVSRERCTRVTTNLNGLVLHATKLGVLSKSRKNIHAISYSILGAPYLPGAWDPSGTVCVGSLLSHSSHQLLTPCIRLPTSCMPPSNPVWDTFGKLTVLSVCAAHSGCSSCIRTKGCRREWTLRPKAWMAQHGVRCSVTWLNNEVGALTSLSCNGGSGVAMFQLTAI